MLAIHRVGKGPTRCDAGTARRANCARNVNQAKEVLANDVPPRWCADPRLVMLIEGRPFHAPPAR